MVIRPSMHPFGDKKHEDARVVGVQTVLANSVIQAYTSELSGGLVRPHATEPPKWVRVVWVEGFKSEVETVQTGLAQSTRCMCMCTRQQISTPSQQG